MTQLTPAGERLLVAAHDLFYQRGIHAVGVDTIAALAGTTKKTLYDRFGSKDNLVAMYLRRRLERWQAFVDERLADVPPAGRALAMFDVLEEWLADAPHGCAFVNANAEIGRSDHPGVEVIKAEKAWMRARYEQFAGVAEVGAQLHLLHEGAIVALTAGGQPDALDNAKAAARSLISGITNGWNTLGWVRRG